MQLEWPRTFGDIYCWFVGSQVNVTISSPELMEVSNSINCAIEEFCNNDGCETV